MNHLIQQAQFLTAPRDLGTVVPCSTRRLDLLGPVRRALLQISALGLYQAAIDGVRVGAFVFAPGWTVASLWEMLTPERIELFFKK